MDRKDAIAWLLLACAVNLRQSQAKTLVCLVQAAISSPRISLANLGRRVAGTTTVKHQIKRAWRFIANGRVEPCLAMTPVVEHLLRRHRSDRPLLVSFDWTDIRGLQTLVAAANVRGRAIPLCWASCIKHVYNGHRSRNAFEQSLLMVLRQMVPRHVRVILLADRGFGRTELGRFCQRLNLHYLIHIQAKVTVRFGGQTVRLGRYPVRKNTCELLTNVMYRDHDPLRQNVVIRWKKGLSQHRDDPWYLMTDLAAQDWTARRLSNLYARRMSIEQLFRDGKNKRHGWSLRDTGLTRPERLDRLILILALAYLLLIGVGLVAKARFRSGHWSSNNRSDATSLFFIGQQMISTISLTKTVLDALKRQLLMEVPKWG